MAERTAKRASSESRIPEEARQHFQAARGEMRKSLEALLPAEFFTHRKKARREMLLAWRGMLDEAIKRMDDGG